MVRNERGIKEEIKMSDSDTDRENDLHLPVYRWSTTPPKEEGFYWGYEKLDAVDADVMIVFVKKDGTCLSVEYPDTHFDMSDFSHWMGPFTDGREKPYPPKLHIFFCDEDLR
jgi:hypothetical protein